MRLKFIASRISSNAEIVVARTDFVVQYIQRAEDYPLGDLVFAENGEPICGLSVQGFLKNISIRGQPHDIQGLCIALKKKPGLGGDAIQHDRAVRSHNNLQIVPQGNALKFQHDLLLRIGMEPGFYFVNENQRALQVGYVLGYA